MKKIFLYSFVLLVLGACKQAKSTDGLSTSVIEIDEGNNAKEPKLQFDETTWDFGKISEGERVEHTFKFKNVGQDELVINNCSASCGCTIPKWPKEPIAPGETGSIKVAFNSAGKANLVTKDVTILANTNPVKTILKIKVFVEKKPTE